MEVVNDSGVGKRHIARRLSDIIRKYWSDRGYNITVGVKSHYVQQGGDGPPRKYYTIVSNLDSGLPIRYEGELKDMERWH